MSDFVFFAVLLVQLILQTSSFAFCVGREFSPIELDPPPYPNYPEFIHVETCCDDRPAHWENVPVPVKIYHDSPPGLVSWLADRLSSFSPLYLWVQTEGVQLGIPATDLCWILTMVPGA